MPDSVQARRPKKRIWIKMAIPASILVVVGTYLWFFGFQNAMAIEVHYSLRNMPFMRAVPVALPDHQLTAGGGTELQYFGYRFEVPWEDLDTAGLKIGKTRAVLPFRSGVLLSFLSSSNHEFVDGLSENTSVKPEAFRAVYGTQAMQTDYDFYKLMLNATPDIVKPFGSRRDVVAGMMLVIVKAMAVPEDSGVFEVDTGEFRGFQYGDLRKHPKRVVVDLCSADRKVELVFIRPDNQPLHISQADVNRVIQTLHRADTVAATKNLS